MFTLIFITYFATAQGGNAQSASSVVVQTGFPTQLACVKAANELANRSDPQARVEWSCK